MTTPTPDALHQLHLHTQQIAPHDNVELTFKEEFAFRTIVRKFPYTTA